MRHNRIIHGNQVLDIFNFHARDFPINAPISNAENEKGIKTKKSRFSILLEVIISEMKAGINENVTMVERRWNIIFLYILGSNMQLKIS